MGSKELKMVLLQLVHFEKSVEEQVLHMRLQGKHLPTPVVVYPNPGLHTQGVLPVGSKRNALDGQVLHLSNWLDTAQWLQLVWQGWLALFKKLHK